MDDYDKNMTFVVFFLYEKGLEQQGFTCYIDTLT